MKDLSEHQTVQESINVIETESFTFERDYATQCTAFQIDTLIEDLIKARDDARAKGFACVIARAVLDHGYEAGDTDLGHLEIVGYREETDEERMARVRAAQELAAQRTAKEQERRHAAYLALKAEFEGTK